MEKLDGKRVAEKILEEVREEVNFLKEKYGTSPSLATILVGDHPASKVYVKRKIKTCRDVGIISRHLELPSEIGEGELLEKIDELNRNGDVNGILVQLPLPSHINVERVVSFISPEKDVDGFHPYNLGNLMRGNDALFPCTPYGIIRLLREYKIEIEGKNCVVVGRSIIVGKPLALLLLAENGTVTICHSRSRNLKEITKRGEILIAAVGKPGFITSEYVGEGAVVVDVGINSITDADEIYRIKGESGLKTFQKRGYALVVDVEYVSVSKIASYLTPVPGGVGPLTIATLMENTLKSFKIQRGI